MWFKKDNVNLKGLEKVEQELNIRLPKFLWEFYRNESKLIRKLRRVSKDANYIYLTEDFDWMIQHNRDFLKLPNNEGLCRGKICIGTDGCGNDSFISLAGDDQRVFFIDHETAEELIDHSTNDFKWEDAELEKYPSIKKYVKFQINIYKELN